MFCIGLSKYKEIVFSSVEQEKIKQSYLKQRDGTLEEGSVHDYAMMAVKLREENRKKYRYSSTNNSNT